MSDFLDQCRRELIRRGVAIPENESLWPYEMGQFDVDCLLRFLDYVHTYDEATAVDRPLPTGIGYVSNIARQWFECVSTGTPMHIVKSRRLVVSWLIGACELWLSGVRPSRMMIAAETFEGTNGSCGFVWRQAYMYKQLRARNPGWKLPEPTVLGGKSPVEAKSVTLPNGSVCLAGNSDPDKFQGSGYNHIRLEELSKYKDAEAIIAQASINTEAPAGHVGGLVVSISNANRNAGWLRDIAPHPEYKLLKWGQDECLTAGNGKKVYYLHYAADPGKSYEWRDARRGKAIPEDQWDREMEGDIRSFDGESVYPQYRADIHTSTSRIPFPSVSKARHVLAGWDCGNTTHPAGVVANITSRGQIQILMEFAPTYACFMTEFAPKWNAMLAELKGENQAVNVSYVCDPAGFARQGNTGESAADEARKYGIKLVRSTNNTEMRRGLLTKCLSETIEGGFPRIVIDEKMCPMLCQALAGGYQWKDNGLEGGERMLREPNKNIYSHVAESLEYLVIEACRYLKIHGMDSGTSVTSSGYFNK